MNKKAKESLIRNFNMWLLRLNFSMNCFINAMKESKTVSELMKIKKDMLLEYIKRMLLHPEHCYFCELADIEDFDCEECPYGLVHGDCTEKNSDYGMIAKKRQELYKTIDKLYYNGEEYE